MTEAEWLDAAENARLDGKLIRSWKAPFGEDEMAEYQYKNFTVNYQDGTPTYVKKDNGPWMSWGDCSGKARTWW